MACKNKRFFGNRKNQGFCNLIFYKRKREKLNRNIIAERKLTSKTIVKIMMAVREFGFGRIVFVVTVFFGELLCQMLIGMR